MPATSKVQQGAAGAALAAKRGEKPASELYGASKGMHQSMSAEQLSHFAKTKRKGLPHRKDLSLLGMNNQGMTTSSGMPTPKACLSMEDAGREIVNHLLEQGGGDSYPSEDEMAEVSSIRSILAALERLQASLANASPEQQHDITLIRAAANSLIRMHGA